MQCRLRRPQENRSQPQEDKLAWEGGADIIFLLSCKEILWVGVSVSFLAVLGESVSFSLNPRPEAPLRIISAFCSFSAQWLGNPQASLPNDA